MVAHFLAGGEGFMSATTFTIVMIVIAIIFLCTGIGILFQATHIEDVGMSIACFLFVILAAAAVKMERKP